MERARRLLRLIELLQEGKPVELERIREELKVSRRTAFRDLEALELAGLPCVFDREAHGYQLARDCFLPPVTLSLDEALALMVLARRTRRGRQIGGHKAMINAALKIESALPAVVRQHCAGLLPAIDVQLWPMADLEGSGSQLDEIRHALGRRRKVWIRYQSQVGQQELETILHPYRISFIRRSWYAIGHSELHQRVRSFKVNRMLEVRLLDEHFEPDPKFNPDEYFGNAWQMVRGDHRYRVAIRFSPRVAAGVEEVVWHSTQETTREADDWLLFRAEVDGLSEIVWWVLGYGQEAVVVEPPELRRLVAEHAQAMLAAYARPPTDPPTETEGES